jgi:hypothetical protein
MAFLNNNSFCLAMVLIETNLGRRWTMAMATFGTAGALYLYTFSTTTTFQLLASCLAAFLQNIMYGVLYCYTPEVFDSQVRSYTFTLFYLKWV